MINRHEIEYWWAWKCWSRWRWVFKHPPMSCLNTLFLHLSYSTVNNTGFTKIMSLGRYLCLTALKSFNKRRIQHSGLKRGRSFAPQNLQTAENLWKISTFKSGGVLRRAVCGRWALGIGWPPVPRVHYLSWKASNGSVVPWAQWDKGTVPKSLGWGLSACHPFTLPQTPAFLPRKISTCATNTFTPGKNNFRY